MVKTNNSRRGVFCFEGTLMSQENYVKPSGYLSTSWNQGRRDRQAVLLKQSLYELCSRTTTRTVFCRGGEKNHLGLLDCWIDFLVLTFSAQNVVCSCEKLFLFLSTSMSNYLTAQGCSATFVFFRIFCCSARRSTARKCFLMWTWITPLPITTLSGKEGAFHLCSEHQAQCVVFYWRR